MNIGFTFKNFEPSAHLKQYARKRFEKLGKYVKGSQEADLQVNLSVEKLRHKADVLLVADQVRLNAMESSEDMYSTVDMVLDKIEAQLKKNREKDKARRRDKSAQTVRMDYLSFDDVEGGWNNPSIVGTDKFEPKPMSLDEAAMQLETVEDNFLVFLNAETEGVNVIYRRKNGDFGLIDPGF